MAAVVTPAATSATTAAPCLGRRMSDGAAFLAEHVIGDTPVRHWVLSLPPPLRYLLAYDPSLVSDVLGAFLAAVFQFLRWKAKAVLGLRSVTLAHPGAVTAIQRSSSHLALIHKFTVWLPMGFFSGRTPTIRSCSIRFGLPPMSRSRKWPEPLAAARPTC